MKTPAACLLLPLLFLLTSARAEERATAGAQGEVKGAEEEPAGTLVPGPDIVVGEMDELQQFGSAGSQVGLALARTSCNAGNPINFFVLPNTDHPLIAQNLYRMRGGPNNTARFEQVAQFWVKHTFGRGE